MHRSAGYGTTRFLTADRSSRTLSHMHATETRASADRRDSIRVRSRFLVRGLGGDRSWTDCLGDIALGGLSLLFPKRPEASRFQITFSCPGETALRRAVADLIAVDDGEGAYNLRLKFTRISFDDQVALAKSFDQLETLPLDQRFALMGWG